MKKIIILVLKCICVMVPVIGICIFARVNILSYADQEAPYYIWNKKMCNESQEKYYSVLFLGDSGSNAAYAPEVLSDSAMSLALGGTTPVENYYVLKEYLDHNTSPQVVYLSFFDEHLKAEDCFYYRIMYTHRFGLTELSDIMKRAKYYNEPSIITDTYLKDFWSYELYLPNMYITSIMNGSFNQRKEYNRNAVDSVGLHQGRYISLSVAEDSESEPVTYSEFWVAPLFDEYYKKIIELCVDHDITVRIVKIPMEENVIFTKEYENQFYVYYNQLQAEYPDLTVDWIKKGYDRFYFTDLVHMNNRGSRMFSNMLKSLHPEDFMEEISDSQYKIFDDNIQRETSCSELFEWISGKEYTIILYDATGDLEQVYTDELQLDTELDIVYTGCDNFYFVSGTNDKILHYDVEFGDGGYKIIGESGAIYDWNPLTHNGLGVCVMNDRSGSQICTKNFKRAEQGFNLQ